MYIPTGRVVKIGSLWAMLAMEMGAVNRIFGKIALICRVDLIAHTGYRKRGLWILRQLGPYSTKKPQLLAAVFIRIALKCERPHRSSAP